MYWDDFLKEITEHQSYLNDFRISTNGVGCSINIPLITRVSLEMINRLITLGEKKIILVFPEIKQTQMLLLLSKFISDVFEGNAEKTYDPNTFLEGQKLKYDNCVVQFDKVVVENGIQMIQVHTSDCTHLIPLDVAPFFQLTNTNRPLSSHKKFDIKKGELFRENKYVQEKNVTHILQDYKTHINHKIIFATSVGRARQILNDLMINDAPLRNYILLGQVSDTGDVENIGGGQLSGEPTLILAKDLYAIETAIKKETEVKALFIDISNNNIVNNALDALDELVERNIPVICTTDTLNSFELEYLKDRNFKIWRWDKKILSSSVIVSSPKDDKPILKKINNCSCHNVEFIKCEDEDISYAIENLYRYRSDIMQTTQNMSEIYDSLFLLSVKALRALIPFSNNECENAVIELNNCRSLLKQEKRFITNEMYNDFEKIINILEMLFNVSKELGKISILRKYLENNKYKKICIVVSDKSDLEVISLYWEQEAKNYGFFRPDFKKQTEYCICEDIDCDITVITSWFNSNNIRKILYSYNTPQYFILLYPCEQKWQNSHMCNWNNILKNTDQKWFFETIKPELCKDFIACSSDDLIPSGPIKEDIEFKEIDTILLENRFRKYIVGNRTDITEEFVEAIPVNFLGDCFAFYKKTHKIITVTDILNGLSNSIKIIFPQELVVGDLVVIRESQRDIIRDIADKILEKNGKLELRKVASKWKESLKVEMVFSNPEEIYRKLERAGCKRTWVTIKEWLTNDEVISPYKKEDIVCIAEGMDDPILKEIIDEVYEAGREIKKVHVLAGKYLSDKLEKTIASFIKNSGNFDIYNIWEPISLQLEDIGIVKLLKVIDIGEFTTVNEIHANIIINE